MAPKERGEVEGGCWEKSIPERVAQVGRGEGRRREEGRKQGGINTLCRADGVQIIFLKRCWQGTLVQTVPVTLELHP